MKYLFITFFVLSFAFESQAQKRKDYIVTLNTTKGTMHMVLYDETPLHKANFINLVKENFYDSLLFHRVMENFMIQGGDPNSKTAKKGDKLGNGGANLTKIPYEFTNERVHKKGALAMASNGNAEKMSSGCQFYIVHGRKYVDDELTKVEKANNVTYSSKQRADYMAAGGTPFLDNRYTVFGEVLDNIGLIDTIVGVSKDGNNRPDEDIKMSMTLKKVRKRKITKLYGFTYPKKK